MTIEHLNFLRDEVGANMLVRLQWMTLQPKRIVIWGRQSDSEKGLTERYPDAEFIILEHDSPSLADHSVDLIFSNLALPWEHNSQQTFMTWQRLLRPDGLCFFSSLGPDTLKEFPDDALNIHRIDMHDLGDALVHARFADPVLDVEELNVVYRDANKMLFELTALDLISGNFICEPADAYTTTYEVTYGHAWAKANNTPNAEGVVKIPLSHLRRR